MASSRKRYKTADVFLRALLESDDESFEDSDTDRDSNYEISDVEPDEYQ